MKSKVCFVSLDPEADKIRAAESYEFNHGYELPDDKAINVNTQRILAPEILFDPKLVKEGISNDYMTTGYF